MLHGFVSHEWAQTLGKVRWDLIETHGKNIDHVDVTGLVLCDLHFFLQKMLITATTTVTLPSFSVSMAISSALMFLLGAESMTLIG